MATSPQKSASSSADAKRIETFVKEGIDLMRAERDAIVTGRFDALSAITERKSSLYSQIDKRSRALDVKPNTDVEARQREGLRVLVSLLSRRAAENVKLLEAAMDGAKKARVAVDEVSADAPVLGVYTAKGERLVAHQPPSRDSLKV